jgi:hypothetical protein
MGVALRETIGAVFCRAAGFGDMVAVRSQESAMALAIIAKLTAISRPRFGEYVVRNFVRGDAKRNPDHRGGGITIIAVDCICEKVTGHGSVPTQYES